ncbi:MAG: putative zinc-binding metallopeptidase, partial [Pseudomonas sp.]|nr:putative zinc-binding metallopeptidase [Pseudomonas sp.]
AGMLNELSRSMGQADFYPFVLPAPVIAKLHFIHLVIQKEGGRADEVMKA